MSIVANITVGVRLMRRQEWVLSEHKKIPKQTLTLRHQWPLDQPVYRIQSILKFKFLKQFRAVEIIHLDLINNL